MAYDIGGMLLRSGQGIGSAVGGGFANLGAGIGSGIGGMLTRRREKQAQQSAQQQFQQILGAYQTNPAGMVREAQTALMSPDENIRRMGEMLMQEASRIEEAQAKQKTKQYVESLGEQAVAEYEAGVPLSDIRKDYFSRQEQKSLQAIAESAGLDIDPELAGQLTGKEIYDLMESKKEATSDRDWETFLFLS